MVNMGDSAEKKERPSFAKGVKSEFKKIIWPDRKATVKQSIAVVALGYGGRHYCDSGSDREIWRELHHINLRRG